MVAGPVFHDAFDQGSEQWLQARCGLLTASEMKLIVTPTFKPASNDKERGHLYELLAQRITGHVEPQYISDDMLRGHEDELKARALYAEHYAPVHQVGFVTNDRWGFKIGYSPDALVGDHGLIECKSRRQKYQVQTVIEIAATGTIPADYLIQCQTGLLVSERQWCDFISYSAGLPMVVIRVYPMPELQDAIIAAATAFEARLSEKLATYTKTVTAHGMIPTERTVEQEIF
jgi:hypothetical protein